MRDDIHKHAPLSSRWQAVMRRFQTEAEQATALDAMQRAVASDIDQFIGNDFLRVLRETHDKAQLELDGVPSSPAFVGDPTKPLSDVERAVHERLSRIQSEHGDGGETLRKTLTDVMTDRLFSHCQSMETTWFIHAPGDPAAKAAATALKQTVAQCNVQAIVEAVLAGNFPRRHVRKAKSLSLDENLIIQ